VHKEGRLLATMPFGFYYSPYLVTVPSRQSPRAYYARLIELFAHFTSPPMLAARLRASEHPFIRFVHRVRTYVKRGRLEAFRRFVALLDGDEGFRAFHEGETPVLPAIYHREYERTLGRFAPLVSRSDRRPELP